MVLVRTRAGADTGVARSCLVAMAPSGVVAPHVGHSDHGSSALSRLRGNVIGSFAEGT